MGHKKSSAIKDCKVIYITSILKGCIELAILICLIVLYNLSKNNPFETYIVGDLSDYFNDVKTLSSNATNNSDNNFNETKEIFNKGKNESSKINLPKELIKRKLASKSFCLEIRDNFIKFRGEKLSTIFDFDHKKIRNYSKANLIISCISILLFILGIILYQKKIKTTIVGSLFIIILLLYVTRFILSVILFYYIEKGDLEKYDKFLDCENVRKDYFNDISKIKNLRKCFIAFFVLNLISQGLEKCYKCCDFDEKEDKKEEKENNPTNMNVTLPNNSSSAIN